MMRDSILRNVKTFVYTTAVPLALCTSFAEARGVGVAQQPRVQESGPAGPATASDSPATPFQPEDAIVAERALIKVLASEAGSLLDDLRLQLAAQPNAKLSIRWRLTKPAEIK